uniref:Uncharacterized protein n=1 Tax=Brugia malayi TaxID=6279 RepID=A8PD93_BRUMA
MGMTWVRVDMVWVTDSYGMAYGQVWWGYG